VFDCCLFGILAPSDVSVDPDVDVFRLWMLGSADLTEPY
jgi:hypothetical protein